VRTASPARLACVPKAAFEAVLRDDDALRQRLLDLGNAQAWSDLERLSALAQAFHIGTLEPVRRVLADGEILFRQGDPGDALYLVRSGCMALYREADGVRALHARVERGGCFGEVALVQHQPRFATAVAEGPTELMAISRARFSEIYTRSAAVREHLQTLAWFYELPRRGAVTQHAGTFLGQASITTLYHLTDGRQFVAYRVVGQHFYVFERLGISLPADHIETLTYSDAEAGRRRELRLDPDGAVLGLTAHGLWPDAGTLHLFVLDGKRIGAPERQRFLQAGTLDEPGVARIEAGEEVICRCIHVTLGRVREAMACGATTFTGLQQETRCGTVCGGCVPRVVELLGASQWVLADVVEERHEAPGIRSLVLVPRDSAYPAARPGQHVIVEGMVRGMRVRRPYTLSSARQSTGKLRITVKQEDQGLFSSWLFGARSQGEPLRITPPRGDFILDPARGPIVCLVAGIGVTPALALVQTVTDEGLPTRVCVHYSGRRRAHMAGLDELEAAARRHPTIALTVRETAHEGRLGLADVAALARQYAGADFFLCGPTAYLDDMAGLLRQAGVAEAQLHIETFTPSGGPIQPLANQTERAAWQRFLLVRPAPQPPRRLWRAWRRLGLRLAHVLNSPRTDWRLGGLQLNPLRLAERRLLARPAGIDPAVPYEYLGVLTVLSTGPFTYQNVCYERITGRGAANCEQARHRCAQDQVLPPNTPDGDTFAYTLPATALVRFPPDCMVDTGWTRSGPQRLLPAYVIRGRTALHHILRSGANTDRGPIPYHYLQQTVGRRDLHACPGRQAAGLFAGQLHNNATWSEDRALSVDMFGFPVIDTFGPGMAAAMEEVSASLDESIARDPEAVVDLNILMSKIAYTIIVRAVFGNVDLAALHAHGEDLSQAMRTLLGYVFQFVMGRRSLPPDYVQLFNRSRGAIRAIVDALRDLARQDLLTEQQRASLPVRVALETATEPDGGYDRLIPLFIPLIIGGHETTGHTMSWAIYEMARDPGLKARVLMEMDAFRTGAEGRPITTADYDARPITFALLAEVLRRHSPLGSVARTALQAGSVPPDPDTGIGGFTYPAGTMFVCSVVGIHMDPKRWPEPQRFCIDRFCTGISPQMGLEERGRQVRRNIRAREEALDLLAFAEGPGRCPGQNFNAHEFILVLDALLARYDFELVYPEREVPHAETVIIAPEKGMLAVRIRHRSNV
jgi:ferredoxin-NADP reductase/cytochrome P450/CRP-like cAMP-binding protein